MSDTKVGEQSAEAIMHSIEPLRGIVAGRIAKLQEGLVEANAAIDESKARFEKAIKEAEKIVNRPSTQDIEAFARLIGSTPREIRMVRLKMRIRAIANRR